eukprot:m.66636 g.66636  ORF g.66636 m.66636 type:complete len:514 (-) comp14058_c2_seq1:212-1753(-)
MHRSGIHGSQAGTDPAHISSDSDGGSGRGKDDAAAVHIVDVDVDDNENGSGDGSSNGSSDGSSIGSSDSVGTSIARSAAARSHTGAAARVVKLFNSEFDGGESDPDMLDSGPSQLEQLQQQRQHQSPQRQRDGDNIKEIDEGSSTSRSPERKQQQQQQTPQKSPEHPSQNRILQFQQQHKQHQQQEEEVEEQKPHPHPQQQQQQVIVMNPTFCNDPDAVEIHIESICSVCYNTLNDDAVSLPACAHTFCADCVAAHCDHAIEANIIPIPCLAEGCNSLITVDIIEKALPPERYKRYRRFLMLRSNRDVRACPHCDTLQSHDPSKGSLIVCKKCSKEFCFYHSNAHPGRTCVEYMEHPPPEERLSIDFINQTSKPCPTCGVAIEHAGGCAHIDCRTCGVDFCWTCGQAGLTGTVIRSCPRCQAEYVVHAYLPLFWLGWLLSLPLQACVAAVSVVVWVLVNLFGGLLRCPRPRLVWPPSSLAFLMAPTWLVYEMTVEILGLGSCFRTCCCCSRPY